MKKYLGIVSLLFVGIFAYYGCNNNSKVEVKAEQQIVDLESYKAQKFEELKALGKYSSEELESIKSKLFAVKDKLGFDNLFSGFANFDLESYKAQKFEELKALGKYSSEELESIKSKLFAVKDKLGFDNLFSGFANFDLESYKAQKIEELKALGKYSSEELESIKSKLFAVKDKIDFDNLFNKLSLDKPFEVAKSMTILYDVNVSTLTTKQKEEIKAVVEANEFSSINLVGYTDMTGNKEYNMNLSKKRSDNVKKYLVEELKLKKIVNSNGLGENGKGKENRKVEIEFMK